MEYARPFQGSPPRLSRSRHRPRTSPIKVAAARTGAIGRLRKWARLAVAPSQSLAHLQKPSIAVRPATTQDDQHEPGDSRESDWKAGHSGCGETPGRDCPETEYQSRHQEDDARQDNSEAAVVVPSPSGEEDRIRRSRVLCGHGSWYARDSVSL